ncbi:uncharacterized protein RCH25_008047 [Pelodytes ibericus]
MELCLYRSSLKPPNIFTNVSYPINGSDVALHCDPLNQTVTSYSFQPNVCSKDHVTCNGSSLLFHPITESDAGNYTCTIANPISTNTSKPLVVRVADYVSAVMIHTNTSTLLWVGVDSVSINCSALGTDVHFSWNLNGAPVPQNSRYHLNQDSSILTISPVDRSDNGSFTCTASNWFSNHTSNSANLSLAWPPEGNITCSAPVTNGTAELQCSWPGGFPSADVRMLFQNKNITEKNQVIVKVNVITINSSTDNLICYGIQGGLEVGCSVRLGKPEAVGFNNNSIKTVAEGESITLSVSLLRSAGRRARPARSIPEEVLPASFSWFRYTPDPTPVSSGGNFLVASTRYTSSLTVSSVTEKQNGTYECVAENQYGSENFLFMINVTAKAVSPTSPSALGPGEIAGIVIGVLAAVGIIGIIIYFSLKAKRKPPTPLNHVYENAVIPQPQIYSTTIPGAEKLGSENSANQDSNYEVTICVCTISRVKPTAHSSILEIRGRTKIRSIRKVLLPSGFTGPNNAFWSVYRYWILLDKYPGLKHSPETMASYQIILTWVLRLSVLDYVSALTEIPGLLSGSVYISGNVEVPENHQIEWSKGTLLATLTPDHKATYYGKCMGRCELFANATLRMDNLLTTDDGVYSVTVKDVAGSVTVNVQLTVYALLIAPTLSISVITRPVNGTNIDLQCNFGKQTVHSYLFYHNEQPISCHLPHILCNQSSPFLSFRPITEHDSGNYTCTIQNPVSSNSSTHLNVNIAVRVSKVTLSNNASSPVLVEKDSVSLKCSSLGTDLSYYWSLEGAALPQNPRYYLIEDNSTLIISPVASTDQGAFTCRVTNYLNNETSNALNLTWFPEGHLECGYAGIDGSLQLSCSWPGGYPAADIQMSFLNVTKSGQNQVTFTMSRDQVILGNELSCTGSHWGPNKTCSLLIDTPQSAGFINNSLVQGAPGSSIILTVSLTDNRARPFVSRTNSPTTSILPATFTWSRRTTETSVIHTGQNFTVISNDYASFLVVTSMANELAGSYMCTADNLMGITHFNFLLNVTSEKESCGSRVLSSGEIAGIVIGSLAVVVLAVFTMVLFNSKRIKNENKNEIKPSSLSINIKRNIKQKHHPSSGVDSKPMDEGVYEDEPYQAESSTENT